MSPVWGDLDARVRGMATHLLPAETLGRLAAAEHLDALADALADLRIVTGGTAGGGPGIEVAVRRWAARQLGTLARWAGDRCRPLAVVFEDEDRRSLRAILRGATQGAAPRARLAGLIPTPTLGPRALETLAGLQTPGAVVATLSAWRHPYGPPLAPATAPQRPDLLDLEVALNRTFFRRSRLAARRGGRHLLDHVAEMIDIENAWSALSLGGRVDVDAEDLFVEGGRALERDQFLRAAAAPDPAGVLLDGPLRATPLGRTLRDAPEPGDRMEAALLRARIARQRRLARRDPLGTAPIVEFVLRLRGQVTDLFRIAWGVGLGASPAMLADGMVTRT